MEEQLRQAQKMEAIGRLAGGAAHDFNNLLQAMLSHLELLRAARGDVDRLDSTAAELEQQIRRGAALTRQLLLFSRRDTAKKELVDLNEIVLSTAGLLRRLVRENIGFHLALSSDPLPAELDRGQIEQVLMNLVVNASDAMPDGGRLTISTSAAAPDSVFFSVSDTGCGIAQELRDRIFDPFFTTKAPDAGTGLGLSVVHGIVARHGGTIEVESTVGGGSAFRIGLPRADRPTAEARAAAGRTSGDLPGGRGERVLLVEDEDAARQALEQTIAMLGYEVVAADSGAAVMRLADGPACDLVLTDLLLPDAFGADLADALRSRWPGVRVLLMSGYATDDQIRHSVETGRVRFLQKPFDMAALARELRAALDEGQPPLS
jgi:CheY-like chemotaxis protein